MTAFLGLCALVVIGRPNWVLTPPSLVGTGKEIGRNSVRSDQKVVGSVETAGVARRIVGRVDGKIILVGWTGFTDPHLSLARLAILVDGVSRGEVTRFYDRPDVAANLGRPDFERSGWEIVIPLNGLRPGIHSLTVQAFAATGESNSLPAVQLRMIE